MTGIPHVPSLCDLQRAYDATEHVRRGVVQRRLFSRLRANATGCWEWQGSLENGYGRVALDGSKNVRVMVHRLAYEVLVGPIPQGLQIDHLCRNRACANPSHLEPVTAQENSLRGETIPAAHSRKTQCPHGHPYDDVNTIINSRGSRECRECSRRRHVAARARRRDARRQIAGPDRPALDIHRTPEDDAGSAPVAVVLAVCIFGALALLLLAAT